MSSDLTDHGSVTFWILLQDNPHFGEASSNMRFAHKKEVGGVELTLVKEGPSFRAVVENPEHGIARIETDISRKIAADMHVGVVWDRDSTKLYLNGEIVAESMYA